MAELTAAHQSRLFDESGLSPSVIELRGYRSLTGTDAATKISAGEFPERWLKDVSGALAIPVYRPDGTPHSEMLRLNKAVQSGKSSRKYVLPVGRSNVLDVHPSVREYVADPEVPLVITEGIIKSDAILSHVPEGQRLCTVAISGAYGWRASVDSEGSIACPDFYDLALGGRRIFLVADSDYQTNKNVKKGWDELARYLTSKAGESKVSIVVVPMRGIEKQGADDYLLHASLESLLSFARSPESPAESGWRGIEVLTGKELYDCSTDEIPWYVWGMLPMPSVMVIAGHTETYKTFHALRLLLDLATGQDFICHPELKVSEPIKTLYLNKEMGRNMMGVRLRHLLYGEDYANIADIQDIIEERLFFVDDARLDLNDPQAVDAFIDVLGVHEPQVVVLDSLSMCWGGDENSASEVGGLYRTLREITQQTGASWVIIHHLSKPQQGGRGSDNPIHQVRGSGQIVQQADSALMLTKQDQDDMGTTVVVHHSKSRAAQHLPTFLSRVTNIDGTGVEIKYAGLLKDLKAEEYATKNSDRQALGDHVMHVIDEQPAMRKDGLRTAMVLKLVAAGWPEHLAKDKPSATTLRRVLKELVDGEQLEIIERNKHAGDLYRLPADDDTGGD